jgi:hypothetical protein
MSAQIPLALSETTGNKWFHTSCFKLSYKSLGNNNNDDDGLIALLALGIPLSILAYQLIMGKRRLTTEHSAVPTKEASVEMNETSSQQHQSVDTAGHRSHDHV